MFYGIFAPKSKATKNLMETFPSRHLERAVAEIAKLPGIGRKTALRLSLHLLRRDVSEVRMLSEAIVQLREDICYCKVCHNVSDTDLCDICANPRRTGYRFGYELLMLNGLLTFCGLWVSSIARK